MDKIGNITVRKRNGKYEYRFEIEPLDGKRRWKSRGGFSLKREAIKAGEEAREEYFTTKGKPQRKQDNISFNMLSELYLERVLTRLEPTSYSMYKTYFDKYFCPELGKMPVKVQRVPEDNIYRIILVLGIYCGMRNGLNTNPSRSLNARSHKDPTGRFICVIQ